ncbi:unnamed protein product [Prorocentrum cordatum]|uniref:Uncharacterized protein n=1 Tax=Prorocentrum cordatum TaxID=2364126 RepID=A0ABN9QNL8_9DINO|nr:unnamed protein product [Polarella glacialis]
MGMARENARGGVWKRSRAERSAARHAAQASADVALQRLSVERGELKRKLDHLVSATAIALDMPAAVADRVVAMVPCLVKLVEGIQPERQECLRRNVALHALAPGMKISCANGKALRKAKHGPRLETLLHAEQVPGSFCWNGGATVFVAGAAAHFLARNAETGVSLESGSFHGLLGVWETLVCSAAVPAQHLSEAPRPPTGVDANDGECRENRRAELLRSRNHRRLTAMSRTRCVRPRRCQAPLRRPPRWCRRSRRMLL